MGKMQAELEQTVKDEFGLFYRMSSVMVQMLLFDAEQKNVTLKAEVTSMENFKSLEAMKDFEQLTAQQVSGAGTFNLNPLKK